MEQFFDQHNEAEISDQDTEIHEMNRLNDRQEIQAPQLFRNNQNILNGNVQDDWDDDHNHQGWFMDIPIPYLPFSGQTQKQYQNRIKHLSYQEDDINLEFWNLENSPLEFEEQANVQIFKGQQTKQQMSVLAKNQFNSNSYEQFKKNYDKNLELNEDCYILIISFLNKKEQQSLQHLSKLFYEFYIPKSNLKYQSKYYSYNFDSVIIKHPSLRSKFIKIIKNAKSLNLLYRASRDGFKSKDFRERCADKGATLTIYHTVSRKQKIQRIVGGFTDIPWSKEVDSIQEYKGHRSQSFLFKLIKDFGLKKMKFHNRHYIDPKYEITQGNNLMPSFLEDLQVFENCNKELGSSSLIGMNYILKNVFETDFFKSKYMTGEVQFYVSNIEVFQVIY